MSDKLNSIVNNQDIKTNHEAQIFKLCSAISAHESSVEQSCSSAIELLIDDEDEISRMIPSMNCQHSTMATQEETQTGH